MNAKKYFLTIQYRMHRIDASDIVRMIESGGITIDDVPDALKKEDVPLEKVKSTGYSYEIIADEEKETVNDGNDN